MTNRSLLCELLAEVHVSSEHCHGYFLAIIGSFLSLMHMYHDDGPAVARFQESWKTIYNSFRLPFGSQSQPPDLCLIFWFLLQVALEG